MRIPGAHSTIGNLDVGTGLIAVAAAQALRDGMIRAQALAAEEKAHAVGRQRYAAKIKQKLNVQQQEAEVMADWLNSARKRLHG